MKKLVILSAMLLMCIGCNTTKMDNINLQLMEMQRQRKAEVKKPVKKVIVKKPVEKAVVLEITPSARGDRFDLDIILVDGKYMIPANKINIRYELKGK